MTTAHLKWANETRYADIWHSRVVSERMRFFFYKKKQNKVCSSTLALYLVPECSLWDSVGTNPKNSNFEHSNFGMSELRTSRTYFKKYKSNSNFKGRTSNFYKDK